MHILENISKDKTFTAGEVIEEQITHLLDRMADLRDHLVDNEEDQRIIESMRLDLSFIRAAVHDVLEG